MLNIKKMILFLIVGVFIFGLIDIVFAGEFTGGNDGFHANITGIGKTYKTLNTAKSEFYKITPLTKDSLTETNNNMFGNPSIAYLRNTTSGFTNGWILNITLFHFNTTASFNNVTRVNISLPNGLTFVATSGSCGIGVNANASTQGTFSAGLNCTVYGSGRDIIWKFNDDTSVLVMNGTLGQNNSKQTNGVGNVTFTINVTSAPNQDGKVDIKIKVSPNSTGTAASTGDYPNEIEFNISNKLYLDGTIPRLSSAVTNSSNSINVTFSENMNASSIKVNGFNITDDTSVTKQVLEVDDSKLKQNDTQFTLTIGVIHTSETPTVTGFYDEASRPTDLAGYAVATNASVEATDGAPAVLTEGSLDIRTYPANLTLIWSEAITAASTFTDNNRSDHNGSIVILIANNTESNYTVTNPFSVTSSGNRSVLILNFTDHSNVTRWRTGVNLTVNAGYYFNDSSSNYNEKAEKVLLEFLNDTTRPTIVNYSYTHNARGESTLLLGFAEPIDIPSVWNSTTQIRLAYEQDHNLSKLLTKENLSDATFVNAYINPTSIDNIQTGNRFYKTVNLTVNTTYTDLIAAWDRTVNSLYLSFENTSMTDLANNPVVAISNVSSQAITWNKDTVAPVIDKITLSDVNVTGPGNHYFTITFSENMTNSTAIVLKKEATTMSTHNFSLVEGTSVGYIYYNFTDSDTNGQWIINVTTAHDLSGNDITAHGGFNFSYDSQPPYLIYAYYLENGTSNASAALAYNGTVKENDTLILVFNEPLQPLNTTGLDVGNFTFRDAGSNLGDDEVNVSIEDNKVTITLTSKPTLSLRGEWIDVVNATKLQGIDNRQLDTNGSSWFIRDKADNFATNKTRKSSTVTAENGPKVVIADYAVEVVPNQAITISFPTCVNTGNMSNYLPSSTSARTFAYFYNTATWGEHTVTQLKPLVGYRFTFNNASVSKLFTYSHSQWGDLSDNWLRVYLNNQSECSLESNEITIDDGWNFLALNGNYYNSNKEPTGRMSEVPDSWLFSLSSAGTAASIQVGSIVKGFGNTTAYSNGGLISGTNNWDNLVIKPYEGYWVQSTASNTFTGTARY